MTKNIVRRQPYDACLALYYRVQLAERLAATKDIVDQADVPSDECGTLETSTEGEQ